MSIEPGTTLLHYKLVEKIGEGGMGVVWKAVDTTLDREVAIKVLPPALATDPERLARFEREAKLLATLHHTNIASIFGLHEANDAPFLAMEFVPGEDLKEHLANGGLPVDEALPIARQIAHALETAHEQGIVHRDLKPANVKLTPDGRVKVLDFGLAKALEPDAGSSDSIDAALSPTLTSAGSRVGLILGTAGYMSPEQARGKPVDRRADLWSFGVVLYEMLTGRRLFHGETISDTLAAVLRADVDLDALPAGTPSGLRRLLRRCLQPDPDKRLQSAGDARIEIEELLSGADSESTDTSAATAAAAAPPRKPWPAVVGALLLAAIAAASAWWLKPTPAAPLRRLSLATPAEMIGPRTLPRISPDGQSLAYIADGRLWIQDLDQLTARPVTGGEKASLVTWSPDSQSLAFTVGSKLWRATIGGDPSMIADLPVAIGNRGGGLAWQKDNTIVYSTGDDNIFKLPVTGGGPGILLEPDPAVETDFHNPQALPDGLGVLYVVHRKPQGIDTLEVLADGQRTVVFRNEGSSFANPVYAPSGHILFSRFDMGGGIWAVPFSLSRLETTGPSFMLTSSGRYPSVSRDGTLLYSNVGGRGTQRLIFVEPDGTVAEPLGEPVQHADNISVSPDGRRMAVCLEEGKTHGVWVYDFERASRSRLAGDAACGARDGAVVWSADSATVVFSDTRNGEIRQRSADGIDEAVKLADGSHPELSPDGRYLLYVKLSKETRDDVWYVARDGSSEPQPLIASSGSDDLPRVSPSGDMVAYVSDESGRKEVYLRPFPSGTGRWQVSVEGGDFPQWSTSGDRLFYLQDEMLMFEVAVTTRPSVRLGTARELFSFTAASLGPNHGYDAMPDGRFLMVQLGEVTNASGDLTLVTNWTAGLEE